MEQSSVQVGLQAAGWGIFQFSSPISTFSKVFLYEILMLSTNFMCGELEYAEKIFYFGLKGRVFDVLK